MYLLRISALTSNSWYKQALEEKKKETADVEKEKTHPVLMENIIKLKKHKENVNQRIKVSREETDSCFDKGPIHMWRTWQQRISFWYIL